MKTLEQMRVGSTAILTEIGGQRAFRRRLMEMGLLPGTPVRLMRRVDVGGLVQLRVRGCSVSLRTSEAVGSGGAQLQRSARHIRGQVAVAILFGDVVHEQVGSLWPPSIPGWAVGCTCTLVGWLVVWVRVGACGCVCVEV